MRPPKRPRITPLGMQKDSQGLRVFKLCHFGDPVFRIYFGAFGRRGGALAAFLVNALINGAARAARLSPRGFLVELVVKKAAFLESVLESKQSKITGSTR